MYTFVSGGQRSGRSNYALRRASEQGAPPWLYVTPGEETDEAVRKRIERHRRDGEAIWRTAVMPPDLRSLLEPKEIEGLGAIVLDGFLPWLTKRAAGIAPVDEPLLLEEVGQIADRLYRCKVPVVVVTHELGLGAIPDNANTNRLVRLAGGANQLLAAMAGSVVFMVSGVPLRVR